MLVLEYKKRNDHKIFHSSAKLVASDSGIDEASKFRHQSIITKKKKKKIVLVKIGLLKQL